MKTILCCFASSRYWKGSEELNKAFLNIQAELKGLFESAYLIDEDFNIDQLGNQKDNLMLAIPMSGGVQPNVIKVSDMFAETILFAGYVKGNFSKELSDKMLINNAAPAIMDVYAVIKRQQGNVSLCIDKKGLSSREEAIRTIKEIKGCKLLAIGKTEPWVISSVKDWTVVKDRFGIEIIDVDQEELIEIYNNLQFETEEEGFWGNCAEKIVEPLAEDIKNATRFQTALVKLIEKYKASGAAIACFNMLKTGTTSCLAVSYVNTYTNYVASCEGDMDSAITMLIMKRLSNDNVWMANPNIQSDGTINFVHCTAPIKINGQNCKYILRNHHESGIGVSTQVELPKNVKMTACRISNNLSQMTIHSCIGEKGQDEPTCRTQLKVRFDDFNSYINNVLGCHQVFVFKDIAQELRYFAEIIGLEIIK